jgi:2-polyprenyl-3-methyl-5-hydroxy-6-metoxy-1,4-benzoquinol methylase/predicted RNA-binding Zn-ribbon protein involved in translation (DUF1610 family)
MNKLEHISCPSCHGAHIHSIRHCIDYYATKETFEVYRCEDCGFTFTQGAPVEAEIGKYYASPDYISHSDTDKGLMNRLYHKVRERMLQKKALLVEKESGKRRGLLLDIGTGTGYFPHKMEEREWDVEAIETNEQARKFAKEHFNIDVMPPKTLYELPDHAYDAITLWHVLEHLEHLDETWQRLSDLLKDKGALIIAVPNCSSYDAKIYKDKWAAYDVPRHLWHFTPKTIQQYAERYGFHLDKIYPMPYDAYYVSMLSEKGMKHYCAFLRGLINGFRSQIHSLFNKKLSSSIIYIFRKS